MSSKLNGDEQVDVIDPYSPDVEMSFDLQRLDDFVTGLGAEFLHYKSMPSPIGQNDRGDLRRNDGVDTITSNGMIYVCAGRFNGTMTDNSRDRKRGVDSNIMDPSESKMVLPRFYNDQALADGKRMYFLPGDRIYVADPTTDVKVSMAQKMDFIPDSDNVPMFPIIELEMAIIDSRNMTYTDGVDFCVTKDGNIRWHDGQKNPGIDPQTGKGRVYSIRYLYRAFWYVTLLLKEVRVTGITEGGERVPERMAYHVMVQREYMYHNQNKGNATNQNKSKDPKRADVGPVESQNPGKYAIPVDMSGIGDGEEQS